MIVHQTERKQKANVKQEQEKKKEKELKATSFPLLSQVNPNQINKCRSQIRPSSEKKTAQKNYKRKTEQDNLTRFLHVIPYSFKCDSCYFYRRSVGLLTTSLTKLAHPDIVYITIARVRNHLRVKVAGTGPIRSVILNLCQQQQLFICFRLVTHLSWSCQLELTGGESSLLF